MNKMFFFLVWRCLNEMNVEDKAVLALDLG